MTINDQIRDEKLQHDINRKDAEISALSSDKTDRYEYLTGKELLPSNQQQIIEQANFTYFLLGKAFEKQRKTTEDQGRKQIEALKEQTKAVEEKSVDKHSMQRKIYNWLRKERTREIQKMSNEIDYDDLIYYFKGPSYPVNFTEYEDPEDIYDKTKNWDKTIQEAEEDHKKFESKLGDITSGNPDHKSTNQSNTIKNAQSLYKSRQKIIDLFNNNAKTRSEAIYEAKQDGKGTGLKILTPKQTFQRLPIALAEVKAGNNWERLLNEIRQIIYSVSIKRNH